MNQKINEVEINGIIYVPKGTESVEYTGEIKIVVLQREQNTENDMGF